mmetsp:Transcript_41256/g.93266  ORF Transcript_41256/g.93266 Transcript_41256/m.93266 type:complete len:223 (+) Transcript_41256:701-1369(+)
MDASRPRSVWSHSSSSSIRCIDGIRRSTSSTAGSARLSRPPLAGPLTGRTAQPLPMALGTASPPQSPFPRRLSSSTAWRCRRRRSASSMPSAGRWCPTCSCPWTCTNSTPISTCWVHSRPASSAPSSPRSSRHGSRGDPVRPICRRRSPGSPVCPIIYRRTSLQRPGQSSHPAHGMNGTRVNGNVAKVFGAALTLTRGGRSRGHLIPEHVGLDQPHPRPASP